MNKHTMTATGLTLAALCVLGLACSKAPTAPLTTLATSRLEVLVYWNQQGLPDRLLEIVELGLTQTTDSQGRATFELRPGSYTLRAHVNVGGPSFVRDFGVMIRAGETEHLDVPDCVPCVTP